MQTLPAERHRFGPAGWSFLSPSPFGLRVFFGGGGGDDDASSLPPSNRLLSLPPPTPTLFWEGREGGEPNGGDPEREFRKGRGWIRGNRPARRPALPCLPLSTIWIWIWKLDDQEEDWWGGGGGCGGGGGERERLQNNSALENFQGPAGIKMDGERMETVNA